MPRSRTKRVLLTVAALVVARAPLAAEAPRLKVQVLDERTVIVRGRGFPQGPLSVSADEDMPHASVACRSEFTRAARPKNGAFAVTIKSRNSDCNFRCGREPSTYVAAVETPGGTTLAEAKFPCVTRRRAAPVSR